MTFPAINLALQGGGALGALTWGVLDRLLEEPRLHIEGISGSSAGAMNAVAVAHGLTQGGAEAARKTLDGFWTAVGKLAYPVQVPLSDHPPVGLVPAPPKFLLGLSRFFSPYQLNPLDINPLRHIVERLFDFEALRKRSAVKLFIGATRVRTGTLRLFTHRELSAQHLVASACLPTLNQAVEIDGEPYWDGGYAGNPALYPLLYDCRAADIVVVMLQPLERSRIPTDIDAIRGRITEIHFNSSFLREMRGILLAREQARRSLLPLGRLERRLRALRFHLIDTDDLVSRLSVDKALNASLVFLLRLKEQGRQRAEAWLRTHSYHLGRRSSIDLHRFFG
jgi:NTE family protein